MLLPEMIELLETLSKKDLKQLKARIEFMLVYSDQSIDTDEYELYNALQRALQGITGGALVPFQVFQKHQSYKRFVHNAEALSEFTNVKFPGITRIQKVKLFSIYAQLIKIYLTNNKKIFPLMSTVVNIIPRIPEMLYSQFPGYVEAGILDKIISMAGS